MALKAAVAELAVVAAAGGGSGDGESREDAAEGSWFLHCAQPDGRRPLCGWGPRLYNSLLLPELLACLQAQQQVTRRDAAGAVRFQRIGAHSRVSPIASQCARLPLCQQAARQAGDESGQLLRGAVADAEAHLQRHQVAHWDGTASFGACHHTHGQTCWGARD